MRQSPCSPKGEAAGEQGKGVRGGKELLGTEHKPPILHPLVLLSGWRRQRSWEQSEVQAIRRRGLSSQPAMHSKQSLNPDLGHVKARATHSDPLQTAALLNSYEISHLY